MDHDEASHDSCTAYDVMPTASPSVVQPTLPDNLARLNQEVQLAGPAPGNAANPLLTPLPPVSGAAPAVPQQPLHQDAVVGQDHLVDPNDKGFGLSGTWDTAGPNRAPRVTGAYGDVPSSSPRIHGDPAQIDLPPRQ